MKTQALGEKLGGRRGRAGCPSDLMLDRLHAGELPPEQAARTQAHVAACESCAAQLRGGSFATMPGVDSAAMQSRIERALAQGREASPLAVAEAPGEAALGERLRRFLRSLLPERPMPSLLALSTVACAAALLVLVGRLPPRGTLDGPGDGAEPGGVREKGGAVLHVHRQVPGGSEEVQSGARMPAGAHLRFIVDLPREGFVAVVGIEEGGALYTAWPLDKGAAARLPAGPGQALPGAVALDESTGRETLYLVTCAPEAGAPRCEARGGRPSCQRGCALSPFIIQKEPPR